VAALMAVADMLDDSGGAMVPFISGCHPQGPTLTVVVKRCFHLLPGRPLEPLEPPAAIGGCLFAGDDPLGECLVDSELAPFKPACDVLLSGSCQAPGGNPVAALIAGIAVGSVRKRMAVFGDRQWKRGFFAAGASDPQPFSVMPLSWSRAYGGDGWRDNPVGCGRDGGRLPNLEHPDQLLTRPKSPQPPMAPGPLNPLWHARASRLGTFPSDWLKRHAPAYPDDFDWSYFNAAPVDQRVAGYLRGDETCIFTHLHPAAPEWNVRLPGIAMRLAVEDQDGDSVRRRTLALALDTLHADTDRGVLTLLWRGWLPVRGRDLGCVRRLLVVQEPLATPTPADLLLARLAHLPSPAPPPPLPVAPPPAPPAMPLPIDWRARLGPGAALAGAQLAGLDLAGADLAGCDLSGADLRGTQLRRARLDRALLVGARLEGCDLSDASLVAADLSGADCTAAVLDRAILDDARLEGTTAVGAWLRGASLDRVQATGVVFDQVRGEGLRARQAVMAGASLAGAVLDDADLSGSDLGKAALIGVSALRLVASRAILTNARIAGGSDLGGARLDHLQAGDSCWQEARLVHADLSDSDLPGAVFVKALLTHARLGACDLSGALFTGADLQRADFAGAKCLHTCFHQADCRNARFTAACCFEADFTECAVDDATFADADLTRTVLT
jgi:uncharacterized protein YjbI with pentapeptide repeats